MSGRRLVAVAVGAALAAYVVSILPGVRGTPGYQAFWDVGVYVTVIAGSALLCSLQAAASRAERVPWALVSVGLTSYGAGAVVFFAVLRDLPEVPYPSVADALWLAFYPAALIGVGLLVKARLAGSSASTWLDGLVSGLGLTSASAVLVLPRVTAAAGGSTAAVITNFAYPLLDLALLAVVVGGMAAMSAWRDRSWRLMAAGFVSFAVADSWYLLEIAEGSYRSGGPVDALFLVSVYLVGLSATARDGAVRAAPESDGQTQVQTRSFLIPGLFGLVALGVLCLGREVDRTFLGVVLAAGALLAAWGRTALAVREIVTLADSRRQARTDLLTGLPNRRAFYESSTPSGRARRGPRTRSAHWPCSISTASRRSTTPWATRSATWC